MKTKSLILVAFAFAFAIGSAFAALLIPEDIYVRAKLKTDPSGPTQCVNTLKQCEFGAGAICTVVVPVTGGTATASTTGTFKTYRGTNCVTVLSSPSNTDVTSEITTIERLVQ
jgi:pyruvate/oxaloacetate carboxyltransferase